MSELRRVIIANATPPISIDFPLYIFANEYESDRFMCIAYSYGDYSNLMEYLKEVMMIYGDKDPEYSISPLKYGIEIYVDYVLIYDLSIGGDNYIFGSTYIPGNSSLQITNTKINWDAWTLVDNYVENTFSYGIKESMAEEVTYREGMTWRSFCESEYNTVEFRIEKHPYTDEDVIVHNDGILINSCALYCKPTDLIEPIFYKLF